MSRWSRHLVAILIATVAPFAAAGEILVGPGDSLQAAIDLASQGDTVLVEPGVYGEAIVIDKRLELRALQAAGVTTIDASGTGQPVVRLIAGAEDTELHGFTITGGSGSEGGGVAAGFERLSVFDCIVAGNVATVDGGGLHAAQGVVLERCVFRRNRAGGRGGGVAICGMQAFRIEDTQFVSNHAGSDGGGLSVEVDIPTVTTTCSEVRRCGFVDNLSLGDGGGAAVSYAANGFGFVLGILQFTNDLFLRNTAAGVGGGLGLLGGSQAAAFVDHCNLLDNSASSGGGLCVGPGLPTDVANTIVRGNQPDQIADTGPVEVGASNVEGGLPSVPGFPNLDVDPAFADAARDDFHLTAGSPCRDAGASALGSAVARDLDGDPRPFGSERDIGLDEFHPHLYALGEAQAGAELSLRIVGVPGDGDVLLLAGAGLADPPAPTGFGPLLLQAPLTVVSLGPIPTDGILELDARLPPATPPGEQFVQALSGSLLTNALVLDVVP